MSTLASFQETGDETSLFGKQDNIRYYTHQSSGLLALAQIKNFKYSDVSQCVYMAIIYMYDFFILSVKIY